MPTPACEGLRAAAVQPVYDRALPAGTSQDESAPGGMGTSVGNLVFIVGFALVISVLAKHLSGPRRKK